MGGSGSPAPSGGLLSGTTRDKYNSYVMQSQESGIKPLPYDQWVKQQGAK